MTACDFDALSHYLDGGLTLPERVTLEGHVRACNLCSRELETLASIDTLLWNWGTVQAPVPAPVHSRVMRAIERKRRLGPIAAMGRMMPAAVGTTIAALLVLVTANVSPLLQSAAAPPASTGASTRLLAKQSVPLTRTRRTAAILGGYAAPQPRPASAPHIVAEVN